MKWQLHMNKKWLSITEKWPNGMPVKDKCEVLHLQQTNAIWYGLWFLVSFFGVGTWYAKNIAKREQLTKLLAFSGVISMIGLLLMTW